MASATNEYKVFLSYAPQDKAWISEFVHTLHTTGIRNWFDLEAIQPGEPWADILQEALRQSETLVVFISSSSVKNPSVLFEVGAAVADHKRIIPVLIGELDAKDIPSPLAQRQVLRASSAAEAAREVARLIEAGTDMNSAR